MPQTTGSLGEDLACDYLKKQGYVIIKRNVKVSYYEIDIIASKNRIISFVEVKTKQSDNQLWDAEDLINHQKMRDFKKGVVIYCSKNKLNYNSISLEIITVSLGHNNKANIKHYFDII
jgi:putative endonuclease